VVWPWAVDPGMQFSGTNKFLAEIKQGAAGIAVLGITESMAGGDLGNIELGIIPNLAEIFML
jgi:hypothetical protein